jgi:hypothetical protein
MESDIHCTHWRIRPDGPSYGKQTQGNRQATLAGPLGFPSLLKGGEDFGWGFAGGSRSDNLFNKSRVDAVRSSIKPIAYVSFVCRPFEVVRSSIKSVLVFVMNDGKIQWVWNEGASHKPMDHVALGFSLNGEFDLRVPGADIDAGLSKAWTRVSALSSAIHVPANTSNSSKITDLVKTLVSSDLFPQFARFVQLIKAWRSNIWKQILDRSFNVEFGCLAMPFLTDEVSNQVALVAREREQSRIDNARSVGRGSAKTTNSVFVRYLVDALPFGNWFPSLVFGAEGRYPFVQEKASRRAR